MHKREFNFKKCLKEGAATRSGGPFYACNRKVPCHIKVDLGFGLFFCGTPMKEGPMKKGGEKRCRS